MKYIYANTLKKMERAFGFQFPAFSSMCAGSIRVFLILFFCMLLINNGFAQPNMKKNVERGFVYMTSAGFLTGVGEIEFEDGIRKVKNNTRIIDVQQLIAYKFNPYVFSGIGVGVDIWKKTAFIPIYANVSVNFLNRKVSPHWYANVGYAFKWYVSSAPENTTRVIRGAATGIQAESGLGVNIKISTKVSLLLLAHYKLQDTDIRYSIIPPGQPDYSLITTNQSERKLYHFIGFKIGVLY